MTDPRPYNDDRLRLARKMRIPNTHNWDPWVDGNDDYAVLRRLRPTDVTDLDQVRRWSDFKDALFAIITKRTGSQRCYPWDYRIGDYAKAGVTALEGG